MEAGTCLVDEAGGRLAAIARPGVGWHGALWMMRAVVERIEVSANALKFLIHPVVDVPNVALGVVAAGNAGLVRHEDGEIAMVIDVFDGFFGAGNPDEVFGTVQVGDVDVEGAVTVEEDGSADDLIHRVAVPLLQRGRLSLLIKSRQMPKDLLRHPAGATFPVRGEGFIFRIHSNRRCRGSRRIPLRLRPCP